MTAGAIGIGTSPLMLMRAVRLAEAGEPVTLLDHADAPGGAWGARSLLGYANVEFGAHLLENRPALYRALADGLGVVLAPDPCLSLLRGRRLPMSWTRAGFHAAVGLRALVRREPDKFLRSWRTAMRTAALVGAPYRYPHGGAARLVQALCRRLEAAGGRIRYGVAVSGIEAGRAGVRMATSEGDRSAARALITSRAFAPVAIDGRQEALVPERGICRNVVMVVRDGGGDRFSYVEVLGDPRVKRVRDLSELVQPGPPANARVLCVQHRQAMSGDVVADARALAEDLARIGLLERAPHVVDAVRTDVALATLTNATLARLQRRSGGRIEAMATTDLAEGFMDNCDRLALSAARP